MNKTKATLAAGITVAAVIAAVAAVGIDYHGVGYHGVAQAATAGEASPSAAAVSSTPVPIARAFDAAARELPTAPVAAPPGATEYAASWRLDSSTGKTLAITITGPGSGCTTLGYVQVSETPSAVTVTPQVVFDQPAAAACTANLSVETGTITLKTPLGHRALVHGATTSPTAAG